MVGTGRTGRVVGGPGPRVGQPGRQCDHAREGDDSEGGPGEPASAARTLAAARPPPSGVPPIVLAHVVLASVVLPVAPVRPPAPPPDAAAGRAVTLPPACPWG